MLVAVFLGAVLLGYDFKVQVKQGNKEALVKLSSAQALLGTGKVAGGLRLLWIYNYPSSKKTSLPFSVTREHGWSKRYSRNALQAGSELGSRHRHVGAK